MPAAIRPGPGRLPRPAWPAAWWSSGCPCAAFGGPPSQGGGTVAPPHLLGLLPAGPWRRWRLSPGPPRCGVAPAPPGPCAGPGGAGRRWWSAPVSGGLARPLWGCVRSCPSPSVSGPHPPYWAGSPFRHPVGRPPNGWAAAATPAGENGGGTGGPKDGPPRDESSRRRFPRWWGCVLFRAALLPFGPARRNLSKSVESCHIQGYTVRWGQEHVHGGRTP